MTNAPTFYSVFCQNNWFLDLSCAYKSVSSRMRSFFIPSLSFGRTGNSTGEPPALLRIFRDVLAMRLRLRLLLQLPADLESAQPKLVVANAPDIHLHDTAGMLHYVLLCSVQ